MKFLDEVAKDIEKDIEGLQGKIQSYNLHGYDHSFKKVSMSEHEEGVFLPISFVIEEEYTVIEDQLAQLESYENHQADHVFWDPIAKYMEDFYSPMFQIFYEHHRKF